MARINTRRAATVGLASFATLTLLPLLAEARPGHRAALLLAAVPTAAVIGYLAGYVAGSADQLAAAERFRPSAPDGSPAAGSPPGDAPGRPEDGDHHLRLIVTPPPERSPR